jgi:putative methionine-R-sulfoxide reductase with GAF domain
MSNNLIRCGILGAQESDLSVLSEIQRQKRVQIVFVYDPKQGAVGLEIAEILGIPGYQRPEELSAVRRLDYVIVSEPRARFSEELRSLSESGAKILNPAGAIKLLTGDEPHEASPATPTDPYTIEDTLAALEKVLDRGELLKFLLEVAVKATHSSAGSIMLYSSDAKELFIAYAIGLSERVIKNTRQKIGEGIAGTVALNKQPQLIHLPADKSLYARDRERLDIGSAISVPLLWGGRLLGVLNVSSKKQDTPHAREDLKRLKTLSRRLSRVLHESLKLQEVQMRHRESKFRTTMGELADTEISSQEKFSVLSRYLAELMGADTVEIFINTAEGDWFVLGGSSRLLTPKSERLRYQKGALSRAFLEERCIVLAESVDPGEDPLSPLSSVVYCHLSLKELGGVLVLEFSDRPKLDEFLLTKDAIVTEISRFVASEMRERKLRRKLEALGKVSDAAGALLGCRSIDDLTSVLTRVVADVLECHRVSIRLRRSLDGEAVRRSFLAPPGESSETWQEEDERQYDKLVQTKKPTAASSPIRSTPLTRWKTQSLVSWIGRLSIT